MEEVLEAEKRHLESELKRLSEIVDLRNSEIIDKESTIQ